MTNTISSGNALLAACLLCVTTLLAGCGSSPHNNYYRLTAQVDAAPSAETPALGVGPVEIPAYLNREKIVYQQEGNALRIATSETWAEPLDAGIERVLAINLAGQLDTQNVRSFPWHPDRAPDYAVKLNLLGLDANDTEASLKAEWLLYRPASAETVQRRISTLQLPLSGDSAGPENIAAAYSTLLYQLSQAIADAIKADVATADKDQADPA